MTLGAPQTSSCRPIVILYTGASGTRQGIVRADGLYFVALAPRVDRQSRNGDDGHIFSYFPIFLLLGRQMVYLLGRMGSFFLTYLARHYSDDML